MGFIFFCLIKVTLKVHDTQSVGLAVTGAQADHAVADGYVR
jgi:hypothetical protein